MNKAKRLKICNYILLAITVLMLASSIQLEVLAARIHVWVWIHIMLGLLFLGLIIWHLYLHFRKMNWFRLLWKQKSPNTRWMTAIGILTFVTALIATAGWIVSPEHSAIGAVHGKLGFLFLIFATGHIFRRIRYYRNIRKVS